MQRLLFAFLVLLTVSTAAAQENDTLKESCALDRSEFTTLFDAIDAARDSGADVYIEKVLALRRAIDIKIVLCYTDFADTEAGLTRANPIAFGEGGIVKIFEDVALWRIANFNENATTLVMETGRSYDAPTEGTKYVVVELAVTCDKLTTESCEVASRHVGIVGNRGVAYEAASISGYIDDFETFGGGQVAIKAAFLVQVDDSDFVVFNQYTSYDDNERTYFATK